MIENLLKNSFPTEYGLAPSSIVVPIVKYNAPFHLTDRISCPQCKANASRANRADCNEDILIVDNNGTAIDVVNFETYIQQFVGTAANVRDRCDFIITDSGEGHNKIVFCDLCCYEEKYVNPNNGNRFPEGKRAKARQQMERSIEVLIEESVTAINLLTYPEKIFLFAWREYGVPDVPVNAARGNALNNMAALMTTASNMAAHTTTHHQQAGHGFTFMQIKYPSVFIW